VHVILQIAACHNWTYNDQPYKNQQQSEKYMDTFKISNLQ